MRGKEIEPRWAWSLQRPCFTRGDEDMIAEATTPSAKSVVNPVFAFFVCVHLRPSVAKMDLRIE
jgi:hypothetical protein